jgi:hypothetical protein
MLQLGPLSNFLGPAVALLLLLVVCALSCTASGSTSRGSLAGSVLEGVVRVLVKESSELLDSSLQDSDAVIALQHAVEAKTLAGVAQRLATSNALPTSLANLSLEAYADADAVLTDVRRGLKSDD